MAFSVKGKQSKGGKSWGKATKSYGKPAANSSKGKGDRLSAIPVDRSYLAHTLRPRPSEVGNSFYFRCGARSDADVLGPETMAKYVSHSTDEGMNRLGRWLSMTSAAWAEGAKVIDDHATTSPSLGRTGLPGIKALLGTAAGSALTSAAATFNQATMSSEASPEFADIFEAMLKTQCVIFWRSIRIVLYAPLAQRCVYASTRWTWRAPANKISLPCDKQPMTIIITLIV